MELETETVPNSDIVVIDIISDVMCPWCYIGMKRLEKALAQENMPAGAIRWRPFQLDPTIPKEGRDRQAYLSAKFGSTEQAAQIYERIETEGAADGIAFDFAAIKIAPNTLDAHRVLHWAGIEDLTIQNALVRRLFVLFFEEGADIGDHETLTNAAADAGMDREVVERLLKTDADRSVVEEEIARAQEMGIQGVPFFLLEQRYGLSGAQPADALADAIRQVAAAKANGELHER